MPVSQFDLRAFTSELGKTGFARSSFFMVEIQPPSTLGSDIKNSVIKSMPLRIEQAALPTRNLLTHNQRYYGPERLIPYGFAVQPLVLNIILSEDMREREFFMRWQDLMVGRSRTRTQATGGDPSSGYFDSGYYDDATKNAKVTLYTYATSPAFQNRNTTGKTFFGELSSIAQAVGFDPTTVTNPLGFDLFGSNKTKRPITVNHCYEVSLVEPYPLNVYEVPLNWAEDGYARLQVQIQYRYFEEKLTTFPDPTSGGGLADQIRSGINMFTKFKPLFSLVQGQGIGGAVRSAANQVGIGALNVGTSLGKILPF